eukprot:1353563-Amorphochlora_amoeboformis.AAC.1
MPDAQPQSIKERVHKAIYRYLPMEVVDIARGFKRLNIFAASISRVSPCVTDFESARTQRGLENTFPLHDGKDGGWRRQSVLKRCYFGCAAIFFLVLVGAKWYTSPADSDRRATGIFGEPIRAAVVVGLKYMNTTEGVPRWYVLMEQRVVKNWLKSTPNRTALMAWPGEFAFPGGAAEPSDQDMEETAKRELQEELLGVHIPAGDFKARLFDVISVQGVRRSYQVHIYIAFSSVNKWLESLEVR